MSKKTKTPKLPKTIAGVTIPKELRKTGGALLAKAQTPEGRQALASGLTMAAAAATAAASRYRSARAPDAPAPPAPPHAPEAVAPPQRPGEGGTPGTAVDPQAIADAIGQAADAMLGRLFGARPPR